MSGLCRCDACERPRYEREMGADRERTQVLGTIKQALASEPSVRLAILHGSQATGTAGPDSDFDVLAVCAVDEPRDRLAQRLRAQFLATPRAVDLAVLDEMEFVETRDVIGGIAHSATRDGRVIYRAQRAGKWPTPVRTRPQAIWDMAAWWLEAGGDNLEVARMLAEHEEALATGVASQLHAAVAKHITALLVSRQIEFKRTYDLPHVLGVLGEHYPDVALELAPVAELHPYADTYPPEDPGGRPPEPDIARLLEIAEDGCSVIADELSAYLARGRPD